MASSGKNDKSSLRKNGRSTENSGNRLSFGGSIRLNDLLNDIDEYGFDEDATEAVFAQFEDDDPECARGDGSRRQSTSDREEGGRTSPTRQIQPSEMKVAEPPPSPSSSSLASSVMFSSATAACVVHTTPLHAEDDLSVLAPDDAISHSERVSLGGQSVGSNDSQKSDSGQDKEKSKGLSSWIDKAKNKLSSNSKSKEKQRSTTPDLVNESSQCAIVGSSAAGSLSNVSDGGVMQPDAPSQEDSNSPDAYTPPVAEPLITTLTRVFHITAHHLSTMPFPHARLYVFVALVAITVAFPGFLVGFLWGLYISCSAFLLLFVSDPVRPSMLEDQAFAEKLDAIEQATEAMEGAAHVVAIVEFKGWMNELEAPARYNPTTYHVNSCRCVLVRLEGTMLRISRPSRAVLKHAFHTDPTLTQAQPTMVGQSIYDLTDATISLRPRRLARRRWWSRKYPIHIRLAEAEEERQRERRQSGMMRRSVSMLPGAATGGMDERQRAYSVEHATLGEESERRSTDSGSTWSEEEELFSASTGARRSSSSVASNGVARTKSSVELSSTASMPADSDKRDSINGRGKKKRDKGIFLFARAAREKERWFHLLREAAARSRRVPHAESSSSLAGTSSNSVQPSSASNSTASVLKENGTSTASQSSHSTPSERRKRRTRERSNTERSEEEGETTMVAPEGQSKGDPSREFMLYKTNRANFTRSMSEAIGVSLTALVQGAMMAGGGSASTTPSLSRGHSLDCETHQMDLGSVKWKPGTIPDGSAEMVTSVNAIASRIFFDFCRDEYWCQQVKEKIQTKLATIHLPYFIENLALSNLELGTATPHIEAVYAPKVDEWGLWVDFEMKYGGGIRLALETRVNLLKLQSGAVEVDADRLAQKQRGRPTRYSDEELPESPEDSPDEDFGAKMTAEKNESTRERAGSKIVSLVESAARSSLFQKAAKLPKVAKVITDISSTRLILNVEVEAIEGTMTVNLPPPPSDRIWYAFRKRPKVSIRAVPQVGDRSVDLSTVSDWIESRLRLLLEKNLVCPNMDDVCIPVMSGNELLNLGYNK